jgi:hypothetical protein
MRQCLDLESQHESLLDSMIFLIAAREDVKSS